MLYSCFSISLLCLFLVPTFLIFVVVQIFLFAIPLSSGPLFSLFLVSSCASRKSCLFFAYIKHYTYPALFLLQGKEHMNNS